MNAVTVLPPRRRVRVMFPTVVLAVLALPLLPFVALGLMAVTRRPFAAAWGLWRLLGALSGALVEVDTPHAQVTVRLF